jgi:trehalose/maltose hydrolase-like predicted phosphorylase
MENKDWIIGLDKKDYQGYYKEGKKVVGRNHLALIANGYVGVRGCFSELFDEKVDNSIHCIGIYDQVGYDDPAKDIWKEIINLPDFMSAPIVFDGERVFLNREDDNCSDFSLSLDMSKAILTVGYTFTSKKGKRLIVAVERFCSYNNKNLVYNRFEAVSPDGDAELIYTPGIDGDVFDANGKHLTGFTVDECENGYILITSTQQHRYKIAISSKHTCSWKADAEIVKQSEAISQKITVKMKKGDKYSVVSQHGVFTSRDSMDPVANALMASFDYAEEKECHIAEIGKHWEIANVEIETDNLYIDKYLRAELLEEVSERVKREVKYKLTKPEDEEKRVASELEAEVSRVKKSQIFMRYNLYILLISIPRDFDYAAIPSRSLSYSTYKGAIFWEVDTYAFPFYAATFPGYARNILMYRFKGLEYAIKKASDLGFSGAFYAWESLDTGEEATKKFVWQDIHSGRMMRNYFGDRQWHIAGDVIYAVWQYFDITDDYQFIEEYGSKMTLLTARFVSSLVYYKVPLKRYEILHTTCPDEYHEEVANNAYTNRILLFAIEKAFRCMEMMEERSPEKLEELLSQLRITEEELEYWDDIREKMYLKEPDSESRVIEQHDGYFELEDICLEEFKSRIIRDEYLGYPVGPAVHTQIIKQADTIQMLVMFKNEFHPIVRKATFDYYDLRTEHGSGDSPNAYGIVAAQVGLIDRALWYFLRSARIDLESANPAKKANFQLGGVHIAPSGGTWQVVHYGFAGFGTDNGVMKFNPILPKGWTAIRYNFFFSGNRFRVEIDRDTFTIKSEPGNRAVTVGINDNSLVTLETGDTLTVKYRKMGNHYFTYNDLPVRIAKEKK